MKIIKEWELWILTGIGLMLLVGIFCFITKFMIIFLVLFAMALLMLSGILLNACKDIINELHTYSDLELEETKIEMKKIKRMVIIGIVFELAVLAYHAITDITIFSRIDPKIGFVYVVEVIVVLLLEASSIFKINDLLSRANTLQQIRKGKR